MIRKILMLLISILSCSAVAHKSSENVQRVIWDKKPIPVTLTVGIERMIHFPSDVSYWIPDAIKPLLNVMSVNGVIYIQSLAPFEETRIRIKQIENNKLYLLDVTSSEVEGEGEGGDLIIMEKDLVKSKVRNKPYSVTEDWPVRLTRFAAQMLYSPERLKPSDSEINEVKVASQPIDLIRGGGVEATVIQSWKGGGLFVTSVLIRNKSSDDILIEMEPAAESKFSGRIIHIGTDIRGKWLNATPQHRLLEKQGTDNDRTCIYLISDRPFGESL